MGQGYVLWPLSKKVLGPTVLVPFWVKYVCCVHVYVGFFWVLYFQTQNQQQQKHVSFKRSVPLTRPLAQHLDLDPGALQWPPTAPQD